MPAYDYECTRCGWKGTRLNVKIAEMDLQKCDQEIPKRMMALFGAEPGTPTTYPCEGELKRSDEIPSSSFQIDASGTGIAVNSKGQIVKGQFGGDSMQKRRFKP